MLQLDQNRRYQDRNAGSRSRQGQPWSGLEKQLLATMAAAAALMEVTSRIQKQTAEALQAVAAPGDDEDSVQQLSRVENATQQLRRVEHAIEVLTSSPDRRRDGLDRRDRRLWPAAAGGRPNWPAEPLTAREAVVLRLLSGTLPLCEIGQELGVSRNTVKSHVKAIYRKLGVSGRRAAVDRGREFGILLSGPVNAIIRDG